MINNIKNSLLVLVIILTASFCNNKKNLQSITLYDINTASDLVKIPLDSIAKSVEIIQIDSSIGYITDLIETEEFFLLFGVQSRLVNIAKMENLFAIFIAKEEVRENI